jgi:hypothetical protein
MEMLRVDGKLPYSFVAGDSFDDYERKIDFYIHIPSHVRGVKSQTEDREDIGIQFYGGKKESHRRSKQKQIIDTKKQFGFLHDIDDIVLVNVPLNLIEGLYEEWEKNGKRPGGVTGLLDIGQKKKIFEGVLQNFFEEKEVAEMWNNRLDKKDIESPTKRVEEVEKVTKPVSVSNKTKGFLASEENRLRQSLNALKKLPNKSEATKRKIKKVSRQLEEILQKKTTKTDEEKNEELKRKIEKETEKEKSTQPIQKQEIKNGVNTLKLSSGEISKMADEFMNDNKKGKIHEPGAWLKNYLASKKEKTE